MSSPGGGYMRKTAARRADLKANRMPNYPSDFTACACRVRNICGVPVANVHDLGLGWRACESCGSTWTGDFKRHVLAPLDLSQCVNFVKT